MPRFSTTYPEFKPPKQLNFDWQDFSGGLNTFFKETEIKDDEVVQFQNLMLTGRGIPTKRWGTDVYFMSGVTGSVRGLKSYYPKDDSDELLAITDHGLLTKKSNASYEEITGVSWASGNNAEMAQIDDKIYIVNGQREFSKYDGTTLAGFSTIGQPADVFATGISGVSGTHTHSFKLTHISETGETAGTDVFQLANQPEEPVDGSILIEWTNASTASGVRKGTNIYRGSPGNEAFIAGVDGEATQYIDDGSSQPFLFTFAPTVDTTGGPIAKYIVEHKSRLVLAGINNDPTQVMISGTVPLHERFNILDNGATIRVGSDEGDAITGLATKGEKILVFKERSIWQIELTQRVYKEVLGIQLTLLEPKATLVNGAIGCASHRSITEVENDIFFLANFGKGVYVIGNEAGFTFDVLRTNEVSLKVRPYFENLTNAQQENACAIYYKNRYLIGFPGKNQTMSFNREKLAWEGPWDIDGRIFEKFVDSNGDERLTYGADDDTDVLELDQRFAGDEGNAIDTIMRTKREEFDSWSKFKTINKFYTRWRNVSGTVDVDFRLEQKDGQTITQKNFQVTTGAGNAGWGADLWADTQYGDTEVQGESFDVNEILRWAKINKRGRNIQFIIKTDELNDNYELISLRGEAQIVGPGLLPADTRV